MRRRVPRLPDAYQEVEYIQSVRSSATSGQYINTGIIPNATNTTIKLRLTPISTSETYYMAGVLTASSNGYYYGLNFSSNRWHCGKGDAGSSGSGKPIIDFSYSWDWGSGVYDVEYRNDDLYINNVLVANATTNTTSFTYPIFLFARDAYGTYDAPSSGILYSCQIYQSDVLVRDFVPCYRKSDNEIGMYDLVNDQFYTNAGSGTFTKGTDSSTLVYKEFQVWPDDQWQLRDETNMANSTTGSSGVIASTNGKFIRPSYSFGGGNGAYSKGTIDGYDVLVASSSHGNVHIGLSDANYTDLMSHKKVKIVWDYFNLGANQSNYTNGIWFGGNESLTDTSSSSTITVGSNWSGMSFSYSTGYSMEQVIKTSDMSCTTTITNLSNQAKSTFTYTKVFSRETNSTYIINGGGNRFIWMNDDYGGGPVRAGNIHVYYTD